MCEDPFPALLIRSLSFVVEDTVKKQAYGRETLALSATPHSPCDCSRNFRFGSKPLIWDDSFDFEGKTAKEDGHLLKLFFVFF